MIGHPINPIIWREMRSRMRNRRTFIGLTGYALLFSGLTALIYAGFYTSASNSFFSGTSSTTLPASFAQVGPYLGKTIFASTVILLLVMLPFTSATLGADAVAGERERQTYEMLRITSLSTAQLVWGKLGAVVSSLLLYVLIPLPLMGLAYIFGGVSLAEIIISVVALFVTTVAFCAWGVLISSLSRSSRMAAAVASSLIFFFIYVIPFLIWMMALFGVTYFDSFINVSAQQQQPLSDVEIALLIYISGFLVSLNPLGAAILTGVATSSGYGLFIFEFTEGTFSMWVVSPWIVYVLFYLAMTLLFVFLTIKRLDKVSDT